MNHKTAAAFLFCVAILGCSSGEIPISPTAAELPKNEGWYLYDDLVFEEDDRRPEVPYELAPICVFEGQCKFVATEVPLVNHTGSIRRISGVRKGCGCTEVVYDSDEIGPGDSSLLKVRVAFSGMVSLESKSISLKPLFSSGKCLSLTQKVACIPRFVFSDKGVLKTAKSLGEDSPNGSQVAVNRQLFLVSDDMNELNSVRVEDIKVVCTPDELSVNVKSSESASLLKILDGKSIYARPLDLELRGDIPEEVVTSGFTYSVQLHGEEAGFYDTTYFGVISKKEKFIFEPKLILLRENEPRAIAIRRKDKTPFAITAILPSTSEVQATQLTKGAQSMHEIRLLRATPNPSSGKVSKHSLCIETSEDRISLDVVFVGG